MEKTWIEYRDDELKLKSKVKELDDIVFPVKDMDGSNFNPEYTEEQEFRIIDLMYSRSERLVRESQKFLWN